MFPIIKQLLAIAIRRPFKTYFKIGSVTFGFTMASNILCTPFYQNSPISIRNNPETYIACLFAKSCYAGLLWPAVPFRITNNSERFFCVGHFVYDCLDLFNNTNGKITYDSYSDMVNDIEESKKQYVGHITASYFKYCIDNGLLDVEINGQNINETFIKELAKIK